MFTKEKIITILNKVKPTKDLQKVTGIIENGYLDSFELMTLITLLCDELNVEITVDYIVPENFNSVDSMVAMIKEIKNK